MLGQVRGQKAPYHFLLNVYYSDNHLNTAAVLYQKELTLYQKKPCLAECSLIVAENILGSAGLKGEDNSNINIIRAI